ncbi:MAG TPA: FGGY family carbohydrate kinase [Polyangiaceae bacterium]|nr:FGGY family carbohydrate kinase [Polyangiaceae bacterium]
MPEGQGRAKSWLLAIDVGTTGVRAAVLDLAGRAVAEAGEDCEPRAQGDGQVEADAEGWWEAARRILGRIGQRAALSQVEAIAVTGQAPTAVLVDADGRIVRPAIVWLDVRAAAEARALGTSLGPGRAEAIGGNRMHAYYLGPKLAWLRAHEPRSLERAAAVLQSHAFLAFRLTGEAACDPSTAMLCAPLFDARTLGWSREGARAAGVDFRLLPRIAPSHEVIGRVTRAAATATGLREGTPVVTGGGDFAASALGAGVVDPGEACLMLGTAGNLLMPVAGPRASFDTRLINSHHVGCEHWLSLGGTLCGAALRWFRDAFAPGQSWEALDEEAAAVSAAPRPIVLPYLQGERTPLWDESARAVFFGMDLTHTRGHLYLALLEGIALGFRHCMVVAEESGLRLERVVAANGAGRSALLRQSLSDALGVPLTYARAGGGTLAGAAVLAGLGAGLVSDPRAARAWQGELVVHAPNPREHARLVDVFARRVSLYAAVRDCWRDGAPHTA